MLSKPITLTFFQVGSHFVTVDQLAPARSGVTLFDLRAGFGDPFLVILKEFQRSLDYFIRIAIRPGPECFGDQLLVFGSKGYCHSAFLWVPDYRGFRARVKAMPASLTEKRTPSSGNETAPDAANSRAGAA
jgi:hypothetical protein